MKLPSDLPNVTLISGSDPAQLAQAAEEQAATILCEKRKTNPTCYCSTCKSIRTRSYHTLHWITPASLYTTDDLKKFEPSVRTTHTSSHPLIVVLEDIQHLSASTANRLLKTLEEPPEHCFFILLTTNKDEVLATIRSRSFLVQLEDGESSQPSHPLTTWFSPYLQTGTLARVELEKLLSSNTPDRIATKMILNQIIDLCHKANTPYSQKAYHLTCSRLTTLPTQINSKLFWHAFYLACCYEETDLAR